MSKFSRILSSFSFRKLLSNKRFTVPFSVLMAFVLWLVIVTKENPIINRSFTDLPVNVNMEGTIASENGMSIIGDFSSQKFTVITRGPTYLVNGLKNSDITLYASAAEVDAPGEYKLDVTAVASTPNDGYEILKISPSTIKVSFDYIDTKVFTVEAHAEGVTPKEGLTVDKVVVNAENDTVSITGPRTKLNKISKVLAFAEVNKTLDSSQTFNGVLKLYNAKGKEINLDNLTLSQNKVKVIVPISKKKTVPLEVSFDKLPEGFDKSSLKYEIGTKTVTIIGKPADVDKIEKISLSPINLSSITKSSNSFDVSVQLPDGVRLLDNIDHFTVKFNLSDYVERTFDISDFTFKNIGNGLKADASDVKNVKVFGPRRELDKLKDSDFYAVVDLSNKKEGEHTLEILVSNKKSKKIWAKGTFDTTVKIKKK